MPPASVSLPRRRGPTPALLAAALVAALAPLGCQTPEEYRQEADEQAYEIIKQRRDELAADDPFTIEPPTGTLRERLLQGGVLEPLDLQGLLEVAAENSRDYRDQREALYVAALDLTLERWNFSVQENGTIVAFLQGAGSDTQDRGLLSNFGLSKLLVSGMRIFGDIGLDYLKTPGSGGFDAQSSASLTITQPLLRGYGADIVREPLTQAERDVLYAARRYERYRRTLAYDVTSRFFGILRQMDTLRNEQENYERRRLLRERNEAFAEAGQLDEIELGQARQDELRAQNSVIAAQRDLDTSLDDFKLFLGLPIEVELPLDASDYLSLGRWGFLELNPAEQDVIRVALDLRLDYMTERERVEDAVRRVAVAEDALRAGLDLVAGADAVSELGNAGNLSGDDVSWSASLSLDLPFDRLPERNAYRTTLIGLERARRAAEESADTIVANLREELRTLDSARQSYEIQTLAVELALRRVESTELKLEAGRAETRDVLESQDSLLTARNTATAALTTYILSGLALYRDMELLRVTPEGVTVDTEPLFQAALEEDLP